MLARLGKVIYWTGCGLAAIALLVVVANVVALISNKTPPQEVKLTLVEGTRMDSYDFSPSIIGKPDPTGEYTWRKIKKGEILVERLGIVQIDGYVPNEAELNTILDYLYEYHAPQIMKIIKRRLQIERQKNYWLTLLFSGAAFISWLFGRAVRYVLAGK